MKIKSVIFGKGGNIITGSRDATVKIWKENNGVFEVQNTLAGHSNFVNAVVEVQPNATFPEGAIISGGTDSLIIVWDYRNLAEPYYTLIGHSNTVCSLAVDESGNLLISGSYDGFVFNLYP